jgi:hypothetical protein
MNEGYFEVKQRLIKMDGRTIYRTLSPKETLFQTGSDRRPHLWMMPRRRWISHTYPMWLWGHSLFKISSPGSVLYGTNYDINGEIFRWLQLHFPKARVLNHTEGISLCADTNNSWELGNPLPFESRSRPLGGEGLRPTLQWTTPICITQTRDRQAILGDWKLIKDYNLWLALHEST